MNAPVTRRALLGATAAVGAVGLPAAAEAEAVIPASDGDAELFALLDRWRETRAVWDATDAPLETALGRAVAAYPADDWRVREAWYGRAGTWSAAAVDDLRRRFEACREAVAPSTLAQQVGEIRRMLTELERQVAGLEAEITRFSSGETRSHGGSTADV